MLPENSLSLNTIHGKHAKIIDTGLERGKKSRALSFPGPGWCIQQGITHWKKSTAWILPGKAEHWETVITDTT